MLYIFRIIKFTYLDFRAPEHVLGWFACFLHSGLCIWICLVAGDAE